MAIKQRSYFSRIERQVKFIYYETDCYNYDKDHMIYGYLTVNNRFEKKICRHRCPSQISIKERYKDIG